eukprot:CAMPEP_0183442956 /NCGR_PEP_ID=MMETSP0370-20130417/90080_1 /TAXON_ID=268820 /ORGANISM="Peridinium aciculiferum, Strain PAER-2" /LENGTH=53 /DNA_ID=CAMNT_0025632775 /DNA_START=26 /DNA_END=187 /DNA_ORIENTATION=+
MTILKKGKQRALALPALNSSERSPRDLAMATVLCVVSEVALGEHTCDTQGPPA